MLPSSRLPILELQVGLMGKEMVPCVKASLNTVALDSAALPLLVDFQCRAAVGGWRRDAGRRWPEEP